MTAPIPSAVAETTRGVAHTPGPWRCEPATTNPGGFAIYGSDRRGGQVLPIVAMTYNWPRNAEANGRLIAAAPDLLAALRFVLDAFAATALDQMTFRQVDALASARTAVDAADRGGRDA